MGDCDSGGFNEDYLNSMTDKLASIATSVTGVSTNESEFDDGGFDFGSAEVMNLLACQPGSDCYKTKRTKLLKKKWKANIKQYDTSPMDLSRGERNYYEYNKGENGGETIYNNIIIDRFAKTAQEFKVNSIDMQQQFMSDLTQTIKQYQAQLIFQIQIEKLLKTRREEQNVLKKNINYFQKIVQTSERKVVYESNNMTSLATYRRIMIFIYYGAIIFFVVFGNFITDKLYLKVSVWLILVIVSVFPIILNMLIMWVFVILDAISYWYTDPHYGYGRYNQYKDVYYNMDNPFDEAPPQPPIRISNGGLPESLTSALSPLTSMLNA
jgi:hypothetical protein